jgi:hypothetical protein
VGPGYSVVRFLTIHTVQTEIQMILNKFKTVQTLFDLKRTFLNYKKLK